jgi:DHA1 family tetracycline resistance protein-like MFS transporter
MATSFLAFALAPTGALFLIGVPFVSLSGIAGPSLQGLATRQVSSSEQGQLQGALSSLRGIGMMIGPLLFTQTFALALRSLHPFAAAPMLLAAALVAGAGVAGWWATAIER